jgi:hypothetical protein
MLAIERRARFPHLRRLVAAKSRSAFIVCAASDPLNDERQPRGPRAEAAEGKAMTLLIQTKPAKPQPQPLPKTQPQKSAIGWRPQVSSLTREEIRAIIIDQIG